MSTKGGGWEWKTARALSKWLTGGEDHHLIRANTSGAWATSRAKAGKALGTSHTGDIAPVGPEAHGTVILFCELFYVECKAYKNEPNWWRVLHNEDAPVWRWWREALVKAKRHGDRSPILILKRNNRPPVFGHLFSSDFFPGFSLQISGPAQADAVTFHLLSEVLASDPTRTLQRAQEAR